MARIVILNWTGDRANWGCQATSLGLLEDLREVTRNPTLAPDTVPLGYKSHRDRAIQIFRGFLDASLRCPRPEGARRVLFEKLVHLAYPGIAQRLREADYVVFMAEGTMNGRSFFGSQRLLMLPYYAAAVIGKPVISLNQTLLSLEADFLPTLRQVYGTFTYNAVRESASLEFAQAQGIQADLIPDSAFRAQPDGRPIAELLTAAPSGPYVCVTGSATVSIEREMAFVRELLPWLADRGHQLCHLTWRPEARVQAEAIAAEWSGLPMLLNRMDIAYRSISTILAGAQAYIGGRYHTSIQAAAAGTPFVPMECGSHKTRGLVQMLGYPLAERRFGETQAVLADLDQVLGDQARFRAAVAAGMDRVNALRTHGLETLRGVFTGA